MSDVLVLNRNFSAIQVTDWRRAITLVYLDRAQVVDEEYRTYDFEDWRELSQYIKGYSNGFIHTPTFKIAIPEVIALKFYDKLPDNEVKFTRKNIYEHYGYRCCYCGKRFASSELNLDHIIPRSRGGKSDWLNVVTACISCNLKKGSFLLEEIGMKLLIRPSKPKWWGSCSLVLRLAIRKKTSWQKFIDQAYWNVELKKE